MDNLGDDEEGEIVSLRQRRCDVGQAGRQAEVTADKKGPSSSLEFYSQKKYEGKFSLQVPLGWWAELQQLQFRPGK